MKNKCFKVSSKYKFTFVGKYVCICIENVLEFVTGLASLITIRNRHLYPYKHTLKIYTHTYIVDETSFLLVTHSFNRNLFNRA